MSLGTRRTGCVNANDEAAEDQRCFMVRLEQAALALLASRP